MISNVNLKQLFNHHLNYWYYNVNQEQYWNDSVTFPSISDENQLALVLQQEQQLLFIAQRTDTVLFRHQPDDGFLNYLNEIGIDLPKIKIILENDSFSKYLKTDSYFIPYINSEVVFSEIEKVSRKIKIFGSQADLVKRINNKFLTRQLAQNHGFNVTEGFFCTDENSLRESYIRLRKRGFERCVIKIPFGSSGKGLKVIEDEKSFELILKFMLKRNKKFHLLLEGWHPIKQSINCQLYLDQRGPTILSITEQQVDDQGVYMGTNFTPEYDPSIVSLYRLEMTRLGKILYGLGYRGICGVDSIIDMAGTLIPIIELNARFTQVTYLLPLISEAVQTYRYIISSYIRFESKKNLNFRSVRNLLDQHIPSYPRCEKIIYTFAAKELQNASKSIYRMYVLFCGDDMEVLQEQIKCLRTFNVDKD